MLKLDPIGQCGRVAIISCQNVFVAEKRRHVSKTSRDRAMVSAEREWQRLHVIVRGRRYRLVTGNDGNDHRHRTCRFAVVGANRVNDSR